jgi:hypothetical protein
VGNFLEDFLFGIPDQTTGESHGGIPAVADFLWPFENNPVSTAFDSTAGQILTFPARGAAKTVGMGLTALDFAESYVLSRPASTLLQASATSKYNVNPLYRDGIQLQDFVDMWNASEYISPGRAAAMRQVFQANQVTPGASPTAEQTNERRNLYQAISNPYPTAGGVSREDYEKAWDESILGTVTSGAYDLSFLLVAGGKGVNAAARAAKKAAGLNTQITELRQLNGLRDSFTSHQQYRKSSGASGKFSVPGRLLEDLAEETDVARIRSSPLLSNWTRSSSFNADELSHLISRTTDPELVTELVLADRGDALALGRLFNTAPDSVWSLTHMNDKLAREFATGGQFIPSPQAARVIKTTFDSAIERDEFFRVVRDMFMSNRIDDPLDLAEDALSTIEGIPVASGRGQQLVALNDQLATARRQLSEAEGKSLPNQKALVDEIDRLDAEALRIRNAAPAVDEFAPTAADQPGQLNALRGTGSDFVPIGTEGIAPIANVTGMAQRWLRRTVADARINRPNTYLEIPLGARNSGPLTTLLFWAGNRQPLNMVSYSRLRPDEVVEEMLAYSRSARTLRQPTWTVTRPDPTTGIASTSSLPAWQWRSEAIARLTAAKTQGDVALDATVESLQKELMSVAVNKYDVPAQRVEEIVNGLQNQVNTSSAQVAQDGFFMDGPVRVILDPVTMRQLPDSRILMPLDDLDWALRINSKVGYARKGRGTRRVLRTGATGLDAIFKLFRTNILFRPGYAPKNSFAEPGISEILADGSLFPRDGLANTLKRFDTNNDRRILQFKYAVADKLPFFPASRDAAKAQETFSSYLEKSRRLDELEAHIADLDSAGTSPATRAANLGLAKEERKIVYGQVKALENDLDLLDDAWTQVDEIPTYSELADRVSGLRTALTSPTFVADSTRRIDELRDLAVTRQSGTRDLAATLEDIKRFRARRAKLVTQRDELFGEAGVESLVRRINLLDEKIGDLEGTARLISRKRTPASGLTPVEQAELEQLSALVFARGKVDVGDLDAQVLLDDITAKLDQIRDSTFTLEPGALKEMQELRAQIAKLDGERANVAGRIAARQVARERFAQRDLSGESDYRLNVGGTEYTIPSPFGTTGNYGTALRADASANLTAAQTLTGGKLNGAGSGVRWRQSGQGEVLSPFDPRYWDELTYVINRHITGDPMANLLLTGKSDMEVLKWFQTPAGKNYMDRMGWTYDQLRGGPRGSVPATPLGGARSTDARIMKFEDGVIAENRRLLSQYFPDPEFRAKLAESREWTPGEVQTALGQIEGLSPIYGTGLAFIGNPAARVGRAVNNGINAIWRNLAVKPESRFARFPFFTREYSRQMEREIRIAQDRGQIVDGAALQNMRTTSQARAMKEVENTFYNVRRMADPIFALRYVTAFANAAWNTAYRYYRLAYRNPGRATVLANTWMNALEFLGTDEEGNEVQSWKDTKYVVFSFPEEWGIPVDPNIKIAAESINLGTQESGYLPTLSMPVSMALREKPDLEKSIRERYPEVWEAMFGFGTNTDPKYDLLGVPLDPFMASYQKKAVLLARNVEEVAGVPNPFFQEIGDEDWVRVASQDFDYRWYQWVKDGGVGPKPTIEQSYKNAQDYFIRGTLASWASPAALRLTPEGEFYRQEWYRIRAKYPNDYPNAVAQMRLMYGPESFFFMQSTSTNRAGMPATQDGLAIWQDNQDILAALREKSPEKPNDLSQLLFLDEQSYKQEEFSEVVYNWQFQAFLPGDDEPIRERMSLQERSDDYKRGMSWSQWNEAIAVRDALKLQYGFETLKAEGDSQWLYDQWNTFQSEFELDPANALWKAERDMRDDGKADRVISGIDYLLANKKFMSSIGTGVTWQTIADYRSELTSARLAYEEAESTDDREAIALQWDDFVRVNYLPQAGNFSGYYERYLAGRDLSGRQLLDRPLNIAGFPLPQEVPANE